MAHRVDSRFVARQSRGGDVAQGVAAFLEKRPLPPWLPAWTEPTYK